MRREGKEDLREAAAEGEGVAAMVVEVAEGQVAVADSGRGDRRRRTGIGTERMAPARSSPRQWDLFSPPDKMLSSEIS